MGTGKAMCAVRDWHFEAMSGPHAVANVMFGNILAARTNALATWLLSVLV
jgi:hypothetical protein